MTQIMTIVWNGMDADNCGAGAPGEDYRLVYNVTSDAVGAAAWDKIITTIRKVAAEFTTEDDETDSPCDLLYDGDRLSADAYIVERMAELMPDVTISLREPEGFTVEIE